jgi:hypothetical protein
MSIDNTASGLKTQIEKEIRQYHTEVVNVGQTYDYSQHKLVRRISLFETHTYPTGKFDSQGNYKFWYDGIYSRIVNEVKNIDFDTKDIKIYSDRQTAPQKDDLPVLISNLKLKEYLRETGQADEINSAIEEGSGWGNIVWKKVKKTYERVDLKNFYVINQTARELCETPVIERHQFSQSDLRERTGKWDNVKEVLEQCKSDTFKTEISSVAKDTTVPYYDIYERNGEVCVKDLKEVKGETPADGDEEKYTFAKIIAAGTEGTAAGVKIEFIVFAEEMKGKTNEDIYKEFHRSRYRGTWWREGMYELLFDDQVRLNQIGNQIARGLEYASKIVLASDDRLIIQNVNGDLTSGDIIKAKDLKQVDMIFHGFSQLVEEWNQVQQHMNDLANSSPIVTGEGLPQRMPFQVAALLNQNSNKLFDYIRQKLAIPFTEIFEEWIVPEQVKDLKAKDIIRLVGDASIMDRLNNMIVEDWYLDNLLAIGPHGPEIAQMLKQQKLEELQKRPHLLMKGIRDIFDDFLPSVSIDITGENSTLPQDLQTFSTFIGLEQDPVRRSAMIEMAMAKKGIDVASLPKMPPQQMMPQDGQEQGQGQPGEQPPPQPTPKPNPAHVVHRATRQLAKAQ